MKKYGYCAGHYGQWWKGKPFTALSGNHVPKGNCKTRGCLRIEASRGWCNSCYSRVWQYRVDQEFLDRVVNSVCEICGVGENLTIDHDHACCPTVPGKRKNTSCGKCVRGVVCQNCNFVIGYAKDSTDILDSMIEYLRTRRLVDNPPETR